MKVYLTADQRIDHSGKHVLAPSAFLSYVGGVTWANVDVPTVAFNPDPVIMVLPIGYHYAHIDYTIKAAPFTAYYFVEPAAPFEPATRSADDTTVYARYTLRVDWPHTLGIGSTNWQTLGGSFLSRSSISRTASGGRYEDTRNRSSAISAEVLGQTQYYGFVTQWVIKEAATNIFAGPQYRYILGRHGNLNDPNTGTFVWCLEQIRILARATKIDYKYYDENHVEQTDVVDATLVAAWIIPEAYIPYTARVWELPCYQYGTVYFKEITQQGESAYTITPSVDMARYAYTVGNGSLDVDLPQLSSGARPIEVAVFYNPLTGPKITATINMQTYDLTNYCLVPFTIIDQSAATEANQQRLLSAAASAIGVGVGVVSQNPVAVAGGLISGVRSIITNASNAPSRSSGGDCYAQCDGNNYALLRLKKFELEDACRIANQTRGPIRAGALAADSIADTLAYWVDTVTPHVVYFEGEVHEKYVGTGDAAGIFAAFENRLAAAYADGVYIWTSASAYRGNMFA